MLELEDFVRDTIVSRQCSDRVLGVLLELTITSINDGRQLFDSPLKEPLFYRRHFKQWVKEGLEEARKMDQAMKPPEPFSK